MLAPSRGHVHPAERDAVDLGARRCPAAFDGRGAEAPVHEDGAADLLGEPPREGDAVAFDDEIHVGGHHARQQVSHEAAHRVGRRPQPLADLAGHAQEPDPRDVQMRGTADGRPRLLQLREEEDSGGVTSTRSRSTVPITRAPRRTRTSEAPARRCRRASISEAPAATAGRSRQATSPTDRRSSPTPPPARAPTPAPRARAEGDHGRARRARARASARATVAAGAPRSTRESMSAATPGSTCGYAWPGFAISARSLETMRARDPADA